MNKQTEFINRKVKIFFLWLFVLTPILSFAANSTEPAVLTVTSDWGNGFVGEVDLTNNTSSAYNLWKLEFDFQYNITSVWSAKLKSHTGNHYVIENENWNGAIPPGSTISFGFQGTPGNVIQTITNVTVNGISTELPHQNSPPVANNDTVETLQNNPITINVLSNDTDADGDSISISAVTTPQNGTTEISSSSIIYTPNAAFFGTDTFNYTANDGNAGTNTALVTVNVATQSATSFTIVASVISSGSTSYPDFVQPMAGSVYMIADKVTFNGNAYESVINNNAWSPTNYPRGWKSITQGDSSSVNGTINPDGNVTVNEREVQSFIITPDSGNRIKNVLVDGSSVGQLSSYTFTDVNESHTITAEFEEGESPQPVKPVAANDSATVNFNTPVTINVLSNDTGNEVTISNVDTPSNGIAVVLNNNIVYTPNTDYIGTDTFNYTIQSSEGLTATALISVVVRESLSINKSIVGYWQNWYDERYIKLGDVSPKYNIIDVAFALPKSDSDMTIVFNLDTGGTSEVEFKSDIRKLQSEGRKVLISLGGATSPSVKLNTESDKQKFVTSIINIIEEYGFNGLDIDLEGGSVGLNPGDNDFKNPTTPSMVNLISAIREIHDYFGADNFMLTTAPETAYVQGGYAGYNGFWGAYLPLLYGLRNELDLIHVQYYNSGSVYGPDGQVYYPGTPDFLVALSESLLKGFPVNRDPNNLFPPFRPDQVAIGLLTVTSEGSGHMQNSEINKALDYLTKGIPYGGQYELQQAGGYPDFGGIMGWSINYDKSTNNYSFVNNAYDYFYGSDPIPNRAPVAVNDSVETLTDTAITLNVLENDTDVDGDTLSIFDVKTPQNGTVEVLSSAIVYTPGTEFSGTDTFEYTVSDGNAGSDTATVTITVSNDPIPVTYTITASIVSNAGGNYSEFIQPMAGDPLYIKGDRVTFNGSAYESLINNNSWSPSNYPGGWKTIQQGGGKAGGTITPTGEVPVNEGQSQIFTMTPNSNSAVKNIKVDNVSLGIISTYTFSDISSDHTISVEFMENSTQPVNISPTVTFNEPSNNVVIKQSTLSPVNISVQAHDSDGTVETLTISVDGNEFNGTNALWTPSEYGTHSIMVSATDNEGAVGTSIITIIVKASDTIPVARKQVIGYFTQWEAWFGAEYGYPEQGVANQLNIDYSKYTMLNYSFFGVAKDGSLHSGDFRNKLIYQPGAVQEPNQLLYSDQYSSWDYWLLFGELEFLWTIDNATAEAGYVIEGSNWHNTLTGLSGTIPIPVAKEGGAAGLIKLCKENNVKLMASIGGWSMCKHFPEMAADPIKKAKFLEGCRYLINMGFDGIDIDWEYPNDPGMNIESASFADYANFTLLMRDIRAEIGPDKILTAAFSCDTNKLENLDWPQLDMYMNYYNMMTYDMNGGWSDVTGHNSALYSQGNDFSWDRTFRYLTEVKGVSSEKINMGVAFYGRGVVTNGDASLGAPTMKIDMTVDPDGPVTRASDLAIWGKYFEQPNFFYIKQQTTKWTHGWDDFAKVPYSVNGASFVSYDNEQSVELKADYVIDNEIGGVIIWHVTGDWEVGTVTNIYGGKLKKAPVNTPLLDVINNVFSEGESEDANSNDVTVSYSFPQHVNYALPHILPNNYSQSVMDSDVENYYDYWKHNYLVDAGTNTSGKQMYRVNYNDNTVSEGQGYGMLITAIMAGHDPEAKNIFDGLLLFAKSMPSEINSNFMDWSLLDTSGNDSAFDGDADIAYALLIADKQWDSNGTINYKSEADSIINALRNNLFSDTTNLPFLGDWVSQNDAHWSNISRPSDFMLANFRAFDDSIANSDWEENIINACQTKLEYIQSNFSSTTGLIPDFIQNGIPATGTVLESNNDGKYFYNACRVPMRVGLDALLSNNVVSKAVAAKISNWAESSTSGNIYNFYTGYDLNGSSFSNYSAISFTAPLGVAAMCTGQQTWLNNIYSSVRTNQSGEYYEDTLNMICMLIMTGNLWDSTIVQ